MTTGVTEAGMTAAGPALALIVSAVAERSSRRTWLSVVGMSLSNVTGPVRLTRAPGFSTPAPFQPWNRSAQAGRPSVFGAERLSGWPASRWRSAPGSNNCCKSEMASSLRWISFVSSS